MNKKDARLKVVNAVVKQIADKSGSKMVENMPQMWYNENIPGSPFTGDTYCHAWFILAEEEIARNLDGNPKRKKLQALIKCRIEDSIYAMINLLKDELELLKTC